MKLDGCLCDDGTKGFMCGACQAFLKRTTEKLEPMSADKPREYWVLAAYDKVLGDQGACFTTPQGGLTHVIEHSAYERVTAAYEAVLEQLRDTGHKLSQVVSRLESANWCADKFKAERDEARGQVAKWEQEADKYLPAVLEALKERDELKVHCELLRGGAKMETVDKLQAERDALAAELARIHSTWSQQELDFAKREARLLQTNLFPERRILELEAQLAEASGEAQMYRQCLEAKIGRDGADRIKNLESALAQILDEGIDTSTDGGIEFVRKALERGE